MMLWDLLLWLSNAENPRAPPLWNLSNSHSLLNAFSLSLVCFLTRNAKTPSPSTLQPLVEALHLSRLSSRRRYLSHLHFLSLFSCLFPLPLGLHSIRIATTHLTRASCLRPLGTFSSSLAHYNTSSSLGPIEFYSFHVCYLTTQGLIGTVTILGGHI